VTLTTPNYLISTFCIAFYIFVVSAGDAGRQTDRQTMLRATSVATGRIYAMLATRPKLWFFVTT